MAMLPVPGPITDRLLEVVAALQRLPVPTIVPGVAATANVPVATARAILTRLLEAGWVRREKLYHLRRKGNAPYGYQLTDAGRASAAERFGAPARPNGQAGTASATVAAAPPAARGEAR